MTVVEVDPVAALEAHMDGHRVAPLETALPDADVVIAATGAIDAVPAEAVQLLKDGAVLANGGHHEREIAIDALGPGEEVRPGVTEHQLPGGRRVYVLAEGRQTNVAGGDGHPVEIMDLSFSVQALSAHLLARGGLEPGLQPFPPELDAEIAGRSWPRSASSSASDGEAARVRDALVGLISRRRDGRPPRRPAQAPRGR